MRSLSRWRLSLGWGEFRTDRDSGWLGERVVLQGETKANGKKSTTNTGSQGWGCDEKFSVY